MGSRAPAPGPASRGSSSTCCSAGSAITRRLSSGSSRSKNSRRIRPVSAGPRAAAKASRARASPEQPQLSASQMSSLAQLSAVHGGGKLCRCWRTSSAMAKSNRVPCREATDGRGS
ncbi:hypothetical protein L107_01747 [Cyanobium sp. Copco_Reservoir_LC18]|nr:hypothetical protein L107_01747 [Cyanobium sp. Copco_Reservoir_LC18]